MFLLVINNGARLATLGTLQVLSVVLDGAAVQLFIHHGNEFRYDRKLSGKESELMVRFLFVSIHRGRHLAVDQAVSLSATPLIMLISSSICGACI